MGISEGKLSERDIVTYGLSTEDGTLSNDRRDLQKIESHIDKMEKIASEAYCATKAYKEIPNIPKFYPDDRIYSYSNAQPMKVNFNYENYKISENYLINNKFLK